MAVHWGRRSLQVEEMTDDRYNSHFEGITETGLDVVVGAHGACSKVRALLPTPDISTRVSRALMLQ